MDSAAGIGAVPLTADTGVAGNSARFDFDQLSARMAQLAKEPYSGTSNLLSPMVGSPLALQTLLLTPEFQLGDGRHPFLLHVIQDGVAKSLGPVTGFTLSHLGSPQPFLAIEGGVSVRTAALQQVFGAGALMIAASIDVQTPPEVPHLAELYVDDQGGGAVVYAVLEGQSLTAAAKWVLPTSDVSQRIDVTVRLFFREDVPQLGVAPLSSMYLFGPGNRAAFDDYRRRVHNSDGLWIRSREGLISWRPLTNPPADANSYIAMKAPAAFGLLQRASGFEAYQDAVAHYEKRPSVVVEPRGEWGEGFVRLIEQPASSERDDNVLAFWMPREGVAAGTQREFAYGLRWGELKPDATELAYVYETSVGTGGVSGVENTPSMRKFVVDFRGRPLLPENLNSQIDAFVSVSGGSLVHTAVSRLVHSDAVRLVIDVDIQGTEPVELRAYLLGNGRQLTESWLYQWRRS